ncbi:hypothetical protein BJX66DRAFT_344215 [Aspergillus keveii]|uniref:F-box domain-containing protein n=1 Tax=Aspergillus keveii TaxID=714993 RepID=A0ABR4FLY0_9EURO
MLRDLPPEIQLLITAHLEDGDKFNLIYTCHYFHDLVISQLYTSLPDAMCVSSELVDALVRNPALQKYPRYIKIEAWDGGNESEPESDSEDGEGDLLAQENGNDDDDPTNWMPQVGLFCKHAKEICLAEEDGNWWAKDIRKGYTDAWIALLLTLSPNLTRLEVQFPLYSRGWVQRIVKWAVERRFTASVLDHVEEVFVSARWPDFTNKGEGEEEAVTDWALPFLGLPSLKRFGSDALHEVHYRVDEPVPTSSATQVALSHCAGLQDVKGFIASFPNLQSYRHESGELALPSRRTYRALLGVKHTLKEIWLHIRELKSGRDVGGVEWPSFKEFTELETLHVPIFLLEDFHGPARNVDLFALLPSSLKTLHVTEAVKDTLPSLFLTLLLYITSGRTTMTEVIVATTQADPARDKVRAVMNALKKPHEDLTADEVSDPIYQAAGALEAACTEREIRFEFRPAVLLSLEDSWRAPDPFWETR